MIYTEDDKAVLLLTTRLADRGAPSLPPGMWWDVARVLSDAGATPAALLGDSLDGSLPPLTAERIATLRSMGGGLGLALESLAGRAISAIPHTREDFPSRIRVRLGDTCPPVLFVAGDPSALNVGGLGIVGSRDVSPTGAKVAEEAARSACRAGLRVVSGAARGVDQLAMRAAASAGGAITGFVADALSKRTRDSSIRHLVSEGRLTIASMQHPDGGFTVGSAMARNKLIYAAADATLVVASDLETGGTWSGATESLRRGYGPVLTWTGDGGGPGNEALIARGAIPVDDTSSLCDVWPPKAAADSPVDQPSLF